jgi:hypothetical protein
LALSATKSMLKNRNNTVEHQGLGVALRNLKE